MPYIDILNVKKDYIALSYVWCLLMMNYKIFFFFLEIIVAQQCSTDCVEWSSFYPIAYKDWGVREKFVCANNITLYAADLRWIGLTKHHWLALFKDFRSQRKGRKQHQSMDKQKLTFFFLTGLRILIIQRSLLLTFMPSKTSLYFPLPTFRTTS